MSISKGKKIPKGYKQTDIGIIPDDWECVKMPEVSMPSKKSIKIGPFGSALKKEFLTKNGFKVYGQENVYTKDMSVGDRFINSNHFKDLKSCEVIPGDFLISMMGTVGKCLIVPEGIDIGIMDSHLLRIKFNTLKIDQMFIVQLFETKLIFDQIKQLSVGGIMEGLSSKIIKNIWLPIPSNKSEQTTIATVLSDSDRLIDQLEKIITKKKNIKEGTMRELFTGKKRLSGFTLEWTKEPLKNLCDYKNGKSFENNTTDNGNFNLVTLNSLDISGKLKKNHLKINFSDNSLCKDDLVIVLSDVAHGNFLGLTDLIPENNKYVLNQRVGALKNIRNILPSLLSKYINFNQKYFKTSGKGSSQQNLGKDDILNFIVYYSKDSEEQTAIAKILSDMDAEIEALKKKRDKYIMLKQGMMEQLLTGKIRIV